MPVVNMSSARTRSDHELEFLGQSAARLSGRLTRAAAEEFGPIAIHGQPERPAVLTDRREPLTARCESPQAPARFRARLSTNAAQCSRFPDGPARRGLAAILPSSRGMECRIEVRDDHSVRTITVAGQLADAHIPDLLLACGALPTMLRIDLHDVLSADAIAIEALRRIRESGAQFVGVPGYIQMKLDSFPR